MGTLQVGRWGDVVLLDGDPLRDIANIDRISQVIKAGEVLEMRYHRNYRPAFWNRPEHDDYDNSRVNVVPVLTTVTVEPGAGGATTIVAKGRGFYDVSNIYLNNLRLDTNLVHIEELRATLPADQKPAAGPYNITVRTPWPGGGISEAKPLTLD